MRFFNSLSDAKSAPPLADCACVVICLLSGERDSHSHLAKTRGCCAVSSAHRLHRLSFAAIWRAPEGPVLSAADRIATVPELRGDAAVARVLQHTNFFAALDFPAEFRGKLKLISPVVNGPRTIRLHPDSIIGARDQLFRRTLARLQTDVRHANNWQAVPVFRTHG